MPLVEHITTSTAVLAMSYTTDSEGKHLNETLTVSGPCIAFSIRSTIQRDYCFNLILNKGLDGRVAILTVQGERQCSFLYTYYPLGTTQTLLVQLISRIGLVSYQNISHPLNAFFDNVLFVERPT